MVKSNAFLLSEMLQLLVRKRKEKKTEKRTSYSESQVSWQILYQ